MIRCPACLTENPDGTANCTVCGYDLGADLGSTYHLPSGSPLKQGRYSIDRVLGEGGFGITYLGTYTQNNAPVAVKELWPEKATRQGTNITWPPSISPAQRQQQIKKFQLEASYLQQCDHEHIVKVYEWFEENGTAYMVMEFVQGKGLDKLLKESKILAEDQVKKYAREVAEALQVVHARNLLHRDIKPDNVILNRENSIVLIDFGAAREFIAGQTGDMTAVLTPGYAPLEQYSPKGKRFPATDIYALCASMYELLTGQPPIEATERVQSLAKKNASDPLIPLRQLRPELSEAIERVVLTGMEIRVEERFQSAAELIDALDGRWISPQHRQAREAIGQGDLAAAIQAYDNCLAKEPQNGRAAVEKAIAHLHHDEQRAQKSAEQAIQLAPDDGRGYGVLGLIYCRQGKWREAVGQLQQAVRFAPDAVWIQGNYAWALGKIGDWKTASRAVETALNLDPNCAFALGVKAWIAHRNREWKGAIAAATPAIFQLKSIQSDRALLAWLYPLRIDALYRAGATAQANRCLQECLHYVPDSAFAWGFLGWQQAERQQWQTAVENWKNATRDPECPAWIRYNLAIALEHLNQWPDAIRAYEACEEYSAPDAIALYRLGTLYGRTGELSKAVSYLQQAVKAQPDLAEAHHNLGWILLETRTEDGQLEDFYAMRSHYRQAVELYERQNRRAIADAIRQAFRNAEISLD